MIQNAPPASAEVAAGVFVVAFAIGIVVGVWLFSAYVANRIGRKFGIGSFGEYCVPIYNVFLLCRCGGMTGLTAVGVGLAPLVFATASFVAGQSASGLEVPLILVTYGCWMYIWGRVAERLGKNFWLWGIGSVVGLGIPVLILAFGSSRPADPAVANRLERHGLALPAPNGAPSPAVDLTPSGPIYDAVYDTLAHDVAPIMRCRTGEHAGQTVALSREGIVIGRDPAHANLVLASPEVSGSHVRVAADGSDGNTVTVTDLGSANGTYIRIENTGGIAHWDELHGTYVHYFSAGSCRIRLGDGAAEFEIFGRDPYRELSSTAGGPSFAG